MTYDRRYAEEVLGADCSHCPLRTAGQFVPSCGPSDASVAFVGEAPGTQEAREGTPFMGPSGRLLNIVNDQYGIKRNEVFLTNATLCRAPDGSTPAKSAIAACKPRLHNELVRIVDTVVALGNTATESILGVSGVTRLRVGPGRQSPYKVLEHLRIIPTVHPAACLRQSDMFPSLVADVGKVVLTHEPWIEPEWAVLDDPVEAIAYLQGLKDRAGDVVVDIEVDVDKDTSFDHPDRYDLLCVGLAENPQRAVIIGENACRDDGVLDAMADALGACRVVAQNGKFDLAGLYRLLGPITLHFDTMLASYSLDERPGIHGLKQLVVEKLGGPNYGEEIGKYVKGLAGEGLDHFHGYGRIPRPILYKYNAYDAVGTFRLMLQQIPLLENRQPSWWSEKFPFKTLREMHDFLVEASTELMYLELNGIKVDREYNRELHTTYAQRLAPLEDNLNEVLARKGLNPINPRSPMQVKKSLLDMRVKVDTTAEDTLKLIIDKIEGKDEFADLKEFCEVLLKHRREQKLFSTYVKGPAKRLYKGRVYSTYSLIGSVTGRLASKNPNMQNIVREVHIKQQYIPGKPENVFVQSDYKQAELRILTWLAEDPYFRELLNDPSRDFFDELTPRLYPGKTLELVGTEISKEDWKELRIRVKAFVYGLGYGRTEYSIASEYKLPLEEAKMAKRRFFETIPAIVEWQARIQKQVSDGHDLITPFGRHRRFHLITKENWDDIKKEALAFLPQSTSSDVCLRAMVRVRRDLRGSGAFIRNIVHDSILVDCPPDMANDVAALLDRRMVESAQELVGDYVMFATDTKIGKHWGEV